MEYIVIAQMNAKVIKGIDYFVTDNLGLLLYP